jgi:predicted transcriptional regulator
MENAMKDVQERNMTLRGAAKKNCVPYSTLKDRIQGRVVHGTKPGVKTVLSPEEESELVTCIQACLTSCNY